MFEFIQKYIDMKIDQKYSNEIQDKLRKYSKIYHERFEIAIDRKYQELITKGVREIFEKYRINEYSGEFAKKNAFKKAINEAFRKELMTISTRHKSIDEMKEDFKTELQDDVDIMIKNYISDEEFLDNIIQRIKNKQL